MSSLPPATTCRPATAHVSQPLQRTTPPSTSPRLYSLRFHCCNSVSLNPGFSCILPQPGRSSISSSNTDGQDSLLSRTPHPNSLRARFPDHSHELGAKGSSRGNLPGHTQPTALTAAAYSLAYIQRFPPGASAPPRLLPTSNDSIATNQLPPTSVAILARAIPLTRVRTIHIHRARKSTFFPGRRPSAFVIANNRLLLHG